MAKEYVERETVDAAIKAAADRRKAIGVPGEQAGFLQAHDIVRSIPAADVVEVRHGRWNEVEHGENGVLCECSTCKEWMLFYYGFDANYCPNCGAKMDGEKDDEP